MTKKPKGAKYRNLVARNQNQHRRKAAVSLATGARTDTSSDVGQGSKSNTLTAAGISRQEALAVAS